VAIIGAGMSGLCMAVTLRRVGITDITIYEKADAVGGTWRDNTYPGLACDVPSRFYQFTFAPKPDWSHVFSPGAEIRDYLTKLAHDFGLTHSIRFGTEVVHAERMHNHWQLCTSRCRTAPWRPKLWTATTRRSSFSVRHPLCGRARQPHNRMRRCHEQPLHSRDRPRP
jgi:cation diffusion facilitator CzcD-associated flavoprotein CzcO